METATKKDKRIVKENVDLDLINHREALSLPEAAVVAGISLSTLYSHLREGIGPDVVRTGERRRILREDLMAWLKDSYESKPKVA